MAYCVAWHYTAGIVNFQNTVEANGITIVYILIAVSVHYPIKVFTGIVSPLPDSLRKQVMDNCACHMRFYIAVHVTDIQTRNRYATNLLLSQSCSLVLTDISVAVCA